MHHKPITSTLCLGHLLKTWLSNFAYGPSQPKFYQVCMCLRCVVAYCGCGCLFASRLAIERLAWGTAPGLDTVQLNVADQIPEIVFVWNFIGVFYTYSLQALIKQFPMSGLLRSSRWRTKVPWPSLKSWNNFAPGSFWERHFTSSSGVQKMRANKEPIGCQGHIRMLIELCFTYACFFEGCEQATHFAKFSWQHLP